MCLDVSKSHVRKPIPEMECFKILRYVGRGKWKTPYQHNPVPIDTGWFMPLTPSERTSEYRISDNIEGGYIHAYVSADVISWLMDSAFVYDKLPSRPVVDECYCFRAIARDVVAEGDIWNADIVCKALYIPAFDATGKHHNAVLDMSR